MTRTQAIEILRDYNKWRRAEPPYDSIDPETRVELRWSPKMIGEAIDVITDAEKISSTDHYWLASKYSEAICSKCGETIFTGFETSREAGEKWETLYPFCPHCGSAMVPSKF